MSSRHDEVIERERELLTTECRTSRERLAELLHEDFREHGASGRMWTRAELLYDLPIAPAVAGQAVDFESVELADDVVLLTYRIEGNRASLRSSVWVNDGEQWRMLFHQGTLTGG